MREESKQDRRWCVMDGSAGWLPKGLAEVVESGLSGKAEAREAAAAGRMAAPEPRKARAAIVDDGKAWVSDPVPFGDLLESGRAFAAVRDGEAREAISGTEGFRILAPRPRRWILPAAIAVFLALFAFGVAAFSQSASWTEASDQSQEQEQTASDAESGEREDTEEEERMGEQVSGADAEESSDGAAAGDGASGADAKPQQAVQQTQPSTGVSQGPSPTGSSAQEPAPVPDSDPDPIPEPETEPESPSCVHAWVDEYETVTKWHYVCDVCGNAISGDIDAHMKAHGSSGNYHPEQVVESIPTGRQHCSICGASR